MNKPELAAAVAAKANISKNSANEAINVLLEQITQALVKGERVALPGLGTFAPSSRAARTGKNPQTGAAIQIAASKSVNFKAGKALKDAVNG